MISILRIIFLFTWTAFMISLSLIVLLLTFDRKKPVIMARTMWSPVILWAAGIRPLTVSGTQYIDMSKSYIFVANHQSHLDTPCIIRSVPINLYFIAKKELKRIPFLGQYMWATGMIFIDRSHRKKAIDSLDKAGKLIKGGKSVLAFPEGTRSLDGKMQSFKKGPFMLAIQHGIEVVPVSVSGTHRVLPSKGWQFTPSMVHVQIGKPIVPPDDTKKVSEFINEVKDQVSKGIN